jgi:predicted O-methyltransferase YrrM
MNYRLLLNLPLYIARPMVWPEIRRQVTRRLVERMLGCAVDPGQSEQETRRAQDWCAQQALGAGEAMGRLDMTGAPPSLGERFPELIAEARERAAACPMRLPVHLGGAGNLDLLYSLCERLAATRVIETGVAYGWSTLAILLSLRNRPGGRLFSIDLPYFQYRNDRWVGVVVPPELRGNWKLYRMADREGLPRALKAAGTLDLVHYDSDKSVEGRLFAYRLLWEALRPGGILMSDDVGDNLGFRTFCEERALAPLIVRQGEKFQGILVKPAV